MDTKELYREILNEHNVNPAHKKTMQEATLTLHGVNPSCGDNIVLYLKTVDGKITDGSFTGSGCAISQASVDMMLDLVIGKTVEQAKKLYEIFMAMILGTADEKDIEQLDEAASLADISKMPSRVKCAQLGWRTLHEMLLTPAKTQELKASASVQHENCKH
ncbi:Fe-S cluster assembly sulfur transfer protein SufU [Treponema pectinovorum]|uniref:Fe-S cluster assembly sulfur transfer protein SufU n=1 Tax=Treponema pectinovorum TaxID=164 RepID=UPI003D8EC563